MSGKGVDKDGKKTVAKTTAAKTTAAKTKAVKKSTNKDAADKAVKKALDNSKKAIINKKTRTAKKAIKVAKHNKPIIIIVVIVVSLMLITIAGLAYTGNLMPLINAIHSFLEGNKSDLGGNNGGNNGGGLSKAEGDLVIHFVDVGQGDYIIVELPDGKVLMIDGGDRFNSVKEKVLTYMTALEINTLDYVLLSHTDADHSGSLDDAIDLADNVHKVYFPKIKTRDDELNNQIGLGDSAVATISTIVYSEFVAAVLSATYEDGEERKSTEYEFLIDEIVIDGGSYRFTMYNASASYYETMSISNSKAINDVSPICVLEYADRRIIFTGDANKSDYATSAEKRFLQAKAAKGHSSYKSDILKVAHHGGKDSSGADFLEFISAEYAIITVGERSGSNSSGNYEGFVRADYYQAGYSFITSGNGAYDHPHRDIAGIPVGGEGRLAASGISELYRTDVHGDIVFIISDNGEISITTQNTASVVDSVITFAAVSIRANKSETVIHIYYEERLRVF